jgi:hypothetical protein
VESAHSRVVANELLVDVARAFMKISALHALAPEQTEPPFLIVQVAVLVLFVILTMVATKRARAEAIPHI